MARLRQMKGLFTEERAGCRDTTGDLQGQENGDGSPRGLGPSAGDPAEQCGPAGGPPGVRTLTLFSMSLPPCRCCPPVGLAGSQRQGDLLIRNHGSTPCGEPGRSTNQAKKRGQEPQNSTPAAGRPPQPSVGTQDGIGPIMNYEMLPGNVPSTDFNLPRPPSSPKYHVGLGSFYRRF